MTRTHVHPLAGFLLLTMVGCGGGGAPAPGASLSTDPSSAGELVDVQRAIDDAAPGATVVIGPGEFRGRLVVRKSVTLVGSGPGTVLRGEPGLNDAVIEVYGAADVVVADLVVSGPHEGVRIRASANVTLEDVVATGNGHEGIDVRQSHAVTILRCDCTQNQSGGVRVREQSFDVLVDDCLVEQNLDHGVEVRDAADVRVRASVVRQNVGDGVRLRDASAIQVTANTIEANLEHGVRAVATPVDPAQLQSENQIIQNGQGAVRVEG